MPALQHALGNQHLGRRRVEIRPLSPLLSSGSGHLERAVLPPSNVDRNETTPGGYALSVQFVPVQFRELPPLQGTAFLEETGRAARGATGAARGC